MKNFDPNQVNNPVRSALSVLRGESAPPPNHRWVKQNHLSAVFDSRRPFHKDFWVSVGDLESRLQAAGLDHIFIKTVRSFPSDDSNIDVVFRSERDFQAARKIAEADGRQATYSYHEPDKIMYRKFTNRSEVQPGWHFHRGVTWNGVPYLPNEVLFSKSQVKQHEGFLLRVPSDEIALLIYSGHALFENFVLPLGELYDVAVLSRTIKDWDAIYAYAREEGWEGGLKAYIRLSKALATQLGVENALPEIGTARVHLGAFPYRLPWGIEAGVFLSRIRHNVRTRRFRYAFRELYAYPFFFVLEQGKLFLGYA